MKELNHRSVLDRRTQQLLVLRFVLLFLNFGGVMETLEKRRVSGCRLLRRFPELLLSRVTVHGADLEETIAKLLRRRVKIAGFRAYDRSIINETVKQQVGETMLSTRLSAYPKVERNPETLPSANIDTMSPTCRKLVLPIKLSPIFGTWFKSALSLFYMNRL